MALNWNALFANGSIVDLSTSLWRARIGIKPSDLGIEDSKEVQKILSLGCHRLAPAKAFEEVMEPARAAARSIDYYSMNFGLIRGARYVPDVNLPKLMGKLKEYKAQFDTAVQDFIANYEDIKAQQMPIIQKALQDAARDPEAAERAFERIQSEYPSADQIRAKFALRWNVYAVQGAKSKAAADAATEETENVKNIIRDMVGQLRTELTDKLQSILEITQKGGKLSDASIGSAMSLLSRVESLNVLGDQVLAQQIAALRTSLTTVDKADVGTEFVQGLNDIQKALETSVEQAIADAESNLTSVGKRKLG